MENKYITVAYKLYVMQDGQKTLVEEATVEHPFQFISGLGTTLERFETEITALKKGDKFEFVIPTAEAYGEYMPEGVRTVSKDMFTIDGVFDEERIFPGAVIPLQDNEGHHFYATVSEVTTATASPSRLTWRAAGPSTASTTQAGTACSMCSRPRLIC